MNVFELNSEKGSIAWVIAIDEFENYENVTMMSCKRSDLARRSLSRYRMYFEFTTIRQDEAR